jgi:hypothetical protein
MWPTHTGSYHRTDQYLTGLLLSKLRPWNGDIFHSQNKIWATAKLQILIVRIRSQSLARTQKLVYGTAHEQNTDISYKKTTNIKIPITVVCTWIHVHTVLGFCGFPWRCDRMAPTATSEASTYTMKGSVGSGCFSNMAEVKSPFSRRKTPSAAGFHTNIWGLPLRRERRGNRT